MVIIYFNCHFERRLATRFMTKQIGGCEKSIWQYYDSFKQDRPLTMGQFEVTGVVWLFRISPFPNSPLRRAGDFVVEGSNVLSFSS